MTANNPYSIEIKAQTAFAQPPAWSSLIAFAALAPIAIMACYMIIPYLIPSLHNTWLFLQGATVLYSSLVVGYLPIARAFFRTNRENRFLILVACPVYFFVGYWVLFFFAVSVAGVLFNEYL